MTRPRDDGVRGEPVPLRDAIAAVGKELGLPEPETVGRVATVWADLVGPAIAQHSAVRSVRDGVCTVTVDAPSWATQLRYLNDDLVRGFAGVLGAGVVTSVRVLVS